MVKLTDVGAIRFKAFQLRRIIWVTSLKEFMKFLILYNIEYW
jgi:hypothetical protein